MTEKIVSSLSLAHAKALHLSGITPALSESCFGLTEALFSAVSGSDTLLTFDINYRPGLWSVDKAGRALLKFAREADILLVGRDKAATLWNTSTAESIRKLLPEPARLIVKDGHIGATEFNSDGVTFVPAPYVDVVEEIGAGDAFAAGYLSAVLNEVDTTSALANGHRCAARSLSAMGDFNACQLTDPDVLT